MTTCAACGASEGRLDPYRDVAKAAGWSHEYAHLDCARYQVTSLVEDAESDLPVIGCPDCLSVGYLFPLGNGLCRRHGDAP